MKEGYVYIAESAAWPGLVKIGQSVEPAYRMYQLSQGLPWPIRCVFEQATTDMDETEARAHAALAQRRIQGTEYFRCTIAEAKAAVRGHYDDECRQHHVDSPAALGRVIRQLRDKRRLLQGQVSGKSRGAVGRLERGRPCSVHLLFEVLSGLGVSLYLYDYLDPSIEQEGDSRANDGS